MPHATFYKLTAAHRFLGIESTPKNIGTRVALMSDARLYRDPR